MDNFELDIEKSDVHYDEGRYQDSLKILQELVGFRLSPQQRCRVIQRLATIYRTLGDTKSALPYSKKHVELLLKSDGPNCLVYAMALKELAWSQVKTNSNKARQNIQKAISIVKKLKLEGTEQYGSMLYTLGRVYYAESMFAEALDNFIVARLVLSKFKEGREYCVATTNLGLCHSKKGEHDKAME